MIGTLAKSSRSTDAARRPYPDPLTIEEYCAVEEAICVALERIFAEDHLPRPFDEVKVNTRLAARLNQMLAIGGPVPAFNCRVFETVVRGGEVENAEGTELEKRPDLTVRRAGDHPPGVDRAENALFVECKVIDKDRTMKRYVPDGLLRFVDGRYAASVTIGLMVGYVDGRYALPTTLRDYLDREGCPCPSRVVARSAPSSRGVYVTTHDRHTVYPGAGSRGSIHVSHLWVAAR
jgi:hypothetical protein